jgi:hypothetical protein
MFRRESRTEIAELLRLLGFWTLSVVRYTERWTKEHNVFYGFWTMDRVQKPSNPKCQNPLESALNIYYREICSEHKLCPRQ